METNEAVDTGVIDNNVLLEQSKKIISGEIEDIASFLRESYSHPVDYNGPISTTLKVCHLYDTHFRLNYWGTRTNASDLVVISSMRIKVDIEGNKYIVDHLNKNELRR